MCFSKHVRDFSGAWLWQGLSAVVSQVVSLLGYTNRKVLSGIDMGLRGLSLPRVPAQIQPRLIASESCYMLTALPSSSHHSPKYTGCGEASLQKMLTLAWLTPPNNPLHPTEPPSHARKTWKGHPSLMAWEQKRWLYLPASMAVGSNAATK